MSDATLAAIDDAIRAHIDALELEARDSDDQHDHDHMLTDWALVYSTSGLNDGKPCWSTSYTTSPSSNPMSSLGMSMWLSDALRNIVGGADILEDDEDDEDD